MLGPMSWRNAALERRETAPRIGRWLLALVVGCHAAGAAQAGPEVPGPMPEGPVALVGATVHPVSGPEIADGVVVFEAGRIVAVGPRRELEIPAGAQTVDLSGQHVYPGLIDAYSDLGLVEVPSVRATRDFAETGDWNPNVRAEVAFHPDSDLLPVARSNGVLAALVAPRGGILRGTSAVMQLDGWTWEEMTVRAPVALHVRWARSVPLAARLGFEPPPVEPLGKHAARIREVLVEARAYRQAQEAAAARGGDPPPFDARLAALGPVLAGEVPVMIEADEVQQILSAVDFCRREGLKLIVHGGYDAPQVAPLLQERDVPVIVAGVHRLPQRREDPYDTPFTVPARLRDAGVRYCIAGAVEASQARNLPYQAATAAAFGLSPDEALRAITLAVAEILGVAGRLGSLDPGKDATLFVSDGHPLEATTRVSAAWIAGRPVDMSNRQTRLYDKYREKYRRLGLPVPE